MKSIGQQFFAVLMAICVLASTVSWTVEKHYCMGHMVDLAVFSSASSCEMQLPSEVSETKSSLDSCCKDEVFVVHGQDDLKLSYSDVDLEEVSYILAFSFVKFLSLKQDTREVKVYSNKPPPILVRDIQLLDQVFLI